MADKQNSQQAPKMCRNNCNFYGNPLYSDYCSKCFNELKADCVQEPTVVSMSPAPSVLAVPAGMEPCTLPPAICEKTSNSLPTSSMQSPLAQIAAAATGASTPTKRVFNKKSRCAECKSRVPLAKQAINQCRCSYFFCDKHRYPEQHECEFDFMTCDRLNLEKNNPKLNSRPKGGLSFTRID
ncbi:hypothetical protein GGH19_001152 [Coemansia sp. RSA 1807]|nr:hypothetical protein GGH19_001152 [Coemansia sp. RSA 1807]